MDLEKIIVNRKEVILSFDDKYIGKDHNTALVSFNSKKIFDDLAKYGIVPRKSLIINCLPILTEEGNLKYLVFRKDYESNWYV